MGGHEHRRAGFVILAVVCFVVAGLSFSGTLVTGDVVGRALFGIAWTALGLVCLGVYFGAFHGKAI